MKLCDAIVYDDDNLPIWCGEKAEWETRAHYYCCQHKHRMHAHGVIKFRRVGEVGWTYIKQVE
mgnify:CR=1 FL=1